MYKYYVKLIKLSKILTQIRYNAFGNENQASNCLNLIKYDIDLDGITATHNKEKTNYISPQSFNSLFYNTPNFCVLSIL